MRTIVKGAAAALALAGLVFAVPAGAKSKEEAWAAWVARAQRIDFALKVQDETVYKAAIKDACTGVTGTVIGQGMAFPMWGQELIGVCTATKSTWIYGNNKGKLCKDLNHSAKMLAKAEAIPEEPRAQPLAQDIAAVLFAIREQGGCK